MRVQARIAGLCRGRRNSAPAASSTKSEAGKLNEPAESHNCDLKLADSSRARYVRSRGRRGIGGERDVKWGLGFRDYLNAANEESVAPNAPICKKSRRRNGGCREVTGCVIVESSFPQSACWPRHRPASLVAAVEFSCPPAASSAVRRRRCSAGRLALRSTTSRILATNCSGNAGSLPSNFPDRTRGEASVRRV